MILDLQRFQAQAQPHWNKLELLLAQLESRPGRLLKPGEAELLQELYAQTAADLNRVIHGALAPELRQYLERLVARAYAEPKSPSASNHSARFMVRSDSAEQWRAMPRA